MSQPHTLASMRAAATKIGKLQRQLADLNTEIKEHPCKVTGGHPEHPKWERILARYNVEKADLVAELNDLQDEVADAKQYLPSQPVPMQSLQSIIEQLVRIEAEFKVRGPEEGWDRLSGYIDTLERDEARVESLLTA